MRPTLRLAQHAARLLACSLALACSSDPRPSYVSIEAPSSDETTGNTGIAIGKCTTGETRTCTKKINEHEGIVNCFCGTQACVEGIWGECGGTGSITTKSVPQSGAQSESGPGQSAQSLSQPSNTAPACKDNPCNPYCVGFDERPPAPITPELTPGNSFEGNPDEWGNGPSGFVKKQDCGSGGDCRTGYPKKCNGNPTNYNKFDGCQADHSCNMSTGQCDRNEAGWKWPASVCAGVDLTAGPACNNGTNDGFPLCNRGNTAVAAGKTIKSVIKTGNWLSYASCPTNPSGTACPITLAAPLQPGQCVRIVAGTHCNWSGNAVVYVNSNKAVAECGMPQPNPPVGVTAPGCSNNWSDVKKGSVCTTFSTGGYSTKVVTEKYTASCPSGTHPQWDRLTFDSTTPAGTSVEFGVRTAPATSPTAFEPASPTLAANAPSTHPAQCSSGGPNPCPVDLYKLIGSVASHRANLELTVTLEPSAQAAPTVSSWQITYSCPPKE